MKLKYIFTILFLFIAYPVYAAEVSTSITGASNINAGEEFTITLNVTADNLWGLSGIINYDTSKINLISSEGLNSFTAVVGTGFSLDTASGKSGTFGILNLKFKATNSFKPGESTTISLTNITGATDSTRLTANNTQKTITVNIPKSDDNNLSSLKIEGTDISNFSPSKTSYDLGNTESSEINITGVARDTKASVSGTGKKTLNYGKNSFDIVVTAENGSTKTYKVTINRLDNRSTNNYLKSLTITNAKINFNKGTLNYNIIVENNIDSISIKADPEDSKSTVTGTGNKKLNNYLNTFSIVVTAENGTQRTYRINISRKDKDGNLGELSKNNNLKSIEIKDYNLDFNPNTLKYNLSVDNTVNKLEISAIAEDSNSTVKINNVEELKVGENLIIIEVTSQSGETKKYELVVVRKNDAPVVGIKDLIETINKTTAKEIEVEIKDDDNKITSDILKELSGKDITLKINKYENDNIKYVWMINGKEIEKEFDFDTLVTFESDDKIKELSNYVESIYLNYSYNGLLPDKTKFKLYVGNVYEENDILNLYYFDEKNNKLVLEKDGIKVKSGYVEYNIEHCSEYILTQANISHKVGNYSNIIIIIEGIVIVGLISFYFIKYYLEKKKNNNIKSL